MVSNKYSFNGDIFTVKPCVIEDIPFHTERVLSYWANVDLDVYKKELSKSIIRGLALQVVNNKDEVQAFIYGINLDKESLRCVSLWFSNKRMLAIMFYYIRQTYNYTKMYFTPHQKNFIPFKFLLRPFSIKYYHSYNTPLEAHLYSEEGENLYQDHFVRYGIKEV